MSSETIEAPRHIVLAKGEIVLIDAADYAEFNAWSWYSAKGLAARQSPGAKGLLYLHRLIMRAEKGQVVQFMNKNTLDCRRSNLRIVTVQQNSYNRRPVRGSTSKYKGVTWCFTHGKWIAKATENNQRTHLGMYDYEEDAARAYDNYVRPVHGEYGRYNFPDEV